MVSDKLEKYLIVQKPLSKEELDEQIVWCGDELAIKPHIIVRLVAEWYRHQRRLKAVADEGSPNERFVVAFRQLAELAYKTGEDKGWTGPDIEVNNGQTIALMHSELSEALEFFRTGNPPSVKIPEYSGVEEEWADVIIRIMDGAHCRNLDVAGAVIAKMTYNTGREYKHGGKEF